MNDNAKIIKTIGYGSFEVSLLQLASGSYCVMTVQDEIETFSEPIRDFANALYVFNNKFMALQGH